jgi:hypothetical protein
LPSENHGSVIGYLTLTKRPTPSGTIMSGWQQGVQFSATL